ncbi:MAG: adenosylcobinamide-GDP ribazoletransferase [Dehalococcoidales bacterium]
MRFFAALSFLTTLRLPLRRSPTPEEVGGSLGYFPLVGLLIGAVLAALSLVLNQVLSATVANALVLAALVVITGALHLDGFVDTCDGLGGHRSVEERWRAMRDSRVGAFGIIGVVLLLVTKYVTLNSIPRSLMTATLLVMPVAGRWAMAYAVVAFPYARPSGMGEAFKRHSGRWSLTAATAITLAAVTGAAWLADFRSFYLAGPILLAAVWLLTAAGAAFLRKRFRGLTGDSYGFLNETAELGVLLLFSLAFWNRWAG